MRVEYSIRLEPKPGEPAPPPRTGPGNTVVIELSSLADDEGGAGGFLLAWRLVQVNGVTAEFPYNEQGMWGYFDARGRSLSLSQPIAEDDNTVEDLPRQLRFIDNCVNHVAVPFPEQPIGRGARWSQPLAREEGDPMTSEGLTTYRLLAVSAKQLVIEVTEDKTSKRQTPRPLEEMADDEVDMQTGSWKHTKKLTLQRGRRLPFGTTRAVVHQTFLRRTGDALAPEQTSSTWDCKVSYGGKVPRRNDE